MDKEVRRQKKIHLALAIAEGESIIAWAQENGVPERTAFRWAQDPKVRREVEPCRRRALNPGAPGLDPSHPRLVTLHGPTLNQAQDLKPKRASWVRRFPPIELEPRTARPPEVPGREVPGTGSSGDTIPNSTCKASRRKFRLAVYTG